jgi:ATP-binding cassette subfamily C (CFTR/MRP) protein 1
LLRSNGYISRLGLQLSSSGDEVEEIPDDRDPELSLEASHKLDEVSEDTRHFLSDIRRKNGEMSVYKYYLKNAGYMAVGLYAFSVVVWVFSIEFSSKSSVLHY